MAKKITSIFHYGNLTLVPVVIITIVLSACSIIRNGDIPDEGRTIENEEESGTMLALNDSHDQVRNGARLILEYDVQTNSFIGTVENTTENTLKLVRVEVHLSNGVELGPTTPTDLDPGESLDISLSATDEDFDGWSAHPEVGETGSGEHDEESEGGHNEGNSD